VKKKAVKKKAVKKKVAKKPVAKKKVAKKISKKRPEKVIDVTASLDRGTPALLTAALKKAMVKHAPKADPVSSENSESTAAHTAASLEEADNVSHKVSEDAAPEQKHEESQHEEAQHEAVNEDVHGEEDGVASSEAHPSYEERVDPAEALSGEMIRIGKRDAKSSDIGRDLPDVGAENAVLSITKRVREEARRELSIAKSQSMSGTLESLIAYNEGWRYLYRQKVNKIFQAELYKKDVIERQAFKKTLGLSAFGPAGMVKEARAFAHKVEARGNVGRAAVIEAMATMIETGSGSQELAGLLRIHPESGLTHLGWLFLGGQYEKNGFYPEALAHYARVVSEAKAGELKNSAHFARARLLLLTGEFTKSKVAFRDLLALGYTPAGSWLANAHLMKGETDSARALYEKYVPVELDHVDPITLMGIGDLRIVYGDYLGAAQIFKIAQETFSVDDVAMAFLRIREADALVVNGEPVKAQVIYTGAQKAFRGEASAMSGLALADSMAMVAKGDSLMRAESLYRSLHRGRYAASRYAHLNLARVQLRLKLYKDSAIALNEFLERYPTNTQQAEAIEIKSEVMFEWIKKLFDESDYFSIVDAVSLYGVEIPFGKKGSTYYRIGKSYAELSLLSEAVSTLVAASEIGVDAVAERSMLELARVYLKQKDSDAVERIARNFNARFPKSLKRAELNEILSSAAYLKGDYKAYAEGVSVTGDPTKDFYKAAALARINKHRDAVKLFKGVAASYKLAGDSAGRKRALLGAADSSFKIRRFSSAVKLYEEAVGLMDKGKTLEKRWALYMITQSYSRLNKREKQKEALGEVVVANGVFGDGAEALYKDELRQ
ncbi:MAG: tetratricopeptide repeat protein, partial [Proteobacteria bacterium]|nr:tetratricopeptide repeat protein [Pseudomonadota bacterium]